MIRRLAVATAIAGFSIAVLASCAPATPEEKIEVTATDYVTVAVNDGDSSAVCDGASASFDGDTKDVSKAEVDRTDVGNSETTRIVYLSLTHDDESASQARVWVEERDDGFCVVGASNGWG